MPSVPSSVAETIAGTVDKAQYTLAEKLPDAWQVTRVGGSLAPRVGVVPVPTAYRPMRPFVSWPGLKSVVRSFTYVNSHGISPGGACITINPQDKPPDTFGDLVFGDGIRPPIRLRDCHLDRIQGVMAGDARYYELHISDRRWRWQQGYMIHGEYNRQDGHGNFVPWTVQSAKELAILCLKRMGERRYEIAFPPGLTSKQSEKYGRYLRAGERFPLTYANPYVVWDHLPAAIALQRLADQFGCRVMYDPISDKVGIYPQGYGQMLPYSGTSVSNATQGIEATRLPRRIGVAGAPVKCQARLPLEATGKDWDGYHVTINNLTFAPILTPASATAKEVRGWDFSPPPEFPNVEPTDRLEYTEAKQHAQDCIFREYRVKSDKSEKTGFNGSDYPDQVFYHERFGKFIADALIISGPRASGDMASKAFKAQDAADKTAYPPFKIVRRQQFNLTPFMVRQVQPAPRRDTGIVFDPNRPNAVNDPGALPDYYNGYSRDRPAECYGTFFAGCANVVFKLGSGASANNYTVEKRRVYLPFEIDPIEQTVTFGQHLYRYKKNGDNKTIYAPAADLYLETGFFLQHQDTNALIRAKYWLDIPGGTAPDIWETHDDVICHIICQYSTSEGIQAVGAEVDDFGDGEKRAKYYLAGMKRRFQNWQSQTVTYNGAMLIPPSGSVQQIRWFMGAGGITTTAGLNCEISQAIPPYPVRKLQENMPPNETAKVLNAASSPFKAKNNLTTK